ncbi:Kelch repeat-containing protein [Nocardioides sp.]|uniref:Kelch repeat-containing protein n=1 Tax=Nocardioides sp. TaxID=35761 RepID=UPI002ED23BFE
MRKYWMAVVVVALLASGCARATGEPASPVSKGGAAAGTGWERLPDPPLSGRIGSVVTAVDHRVLVAGGWEWLCPPNADCSFPDRPPLRDGALLDVTTGEWRPVAEAPFAFHDARAVALGTTVFVLTGCRGTAACDGPLELLGYDVDADRWTELGAVPSPAPSYAALVPVGDRLLVLADSDENGEHPDHLYDPDTDRWQQLPDDPLPRVYDRWATADGDRLLVFGSSITSDPPVKLAAAYDLGEGSWSRLPDAPGAGYQVWRSGDEAWLNPHFGSTGGGVLDLRTDSWSGFPDPPPGQGQDEAVDLAGVIGWGSASYEYAEGVVRDTEHDRWLRIPERTPSTYDERLTALGDALVVFGGQRWDDRDGELLSETWIWRP